MSSTNIKWVPVLYVTHQIEDGLTAGVPERLPGLYDSADAALSAATAALAVRPDCHSATALSVLEALRGMGVQAVVLVCFSAHNLTLVAQGVHGRAYVFADHDKSGTGQGAAEQTGLPWCMSPVEGEDANDLHQRAGVLAVRQLLMRVRLQRKVA